MSTGDDYYRQMQEFANSITESITKEDRYDQMQDFANTLEQSVSSDSLHEYIKQQHFYQYLDAGQ
eukprot:1755119-Pleurochrysis_carterae.AAC.1